MSDIGWLGWTTCILAALVVIVLGVDALVSNVRERRRKRDEVALLIAMGEGMNVPYVPGESVTEYRNIIIRKRDRDANLCRCNGANRLA